MITNMQQPGHLDFIFVPVYGRVGYSDHVSLLIWIVRKIGFVSTDTAL